MNCSNLFPEPFRGYWRSFWWSSRQEMWSSSSGGMCRSAPAPREPLCDSQDLCHCPHSTENNFCCAFFVSIVCGYSSVNKSTLLHLGFLQMLFGNCAMHQCRVFFLHRLCFHGNMSSWVTVAAGDTCNGFFFFLRGTGSKFRVLTCTWNATVTFPFRNKIPSDRKKKKDVTSPPTICPLLD